MGVAQSSENSPLAAAARSAALPDVTNGAAPALLSFLEAPSHAAHALYTGK
jgi:hypothetical protein